MAISYERISELCHMKNVETDPAEKYLKKIVAGTSMLVPNSWNRAMADMIFDARVYSWNRYTILAVTAAILEHYGV